MRRRILVWLGLGVCAASAVGCKSQPNARYIYQDGEFGVIGIPQNSPYGARDYRAQALELMAKHFPDGYEVVRAEEVIEGQRVLDRSRKSELETEPTIGALDQKIKLGKLAESMSTQTKDSIPILESRIIYRRRTGELPPGANGFASTAALTPEFYLDPNEMARCRERLEIAEAKKAKDPKDTKTAEKSDKPDKATDPEAQKVAHEAPK